MIECRLKEREKSYPIWEAVMHSYLGTEFNPGSRLQSIFNTDFFDGHENGINKCMYIPYTKIFICKRNSNLEFSKNGLDYSHTVKFEDSHAMATVKVGLSLQEMNESQCNTALLACFVCVCVCVHMLVCVVHEKKISSTNGRFFLSWIRL